MDCFLVVLVVGLLFWLLVLEELVVLEGWLLVEIGRLVVIGLEGGLLVLFWLLVLEDWKDGCYLGGWYWKTLVVVLVVGIGRLEGWLVFWKAG